MVFSSDVGTPLDESNVRKAFNRVLDTAELHRRGPHQSFDVRCQADVIRRWTVDALDDVDKAFGVRHHTQEGSKTSAQPSGAQFNAEFLASIKGVVISAIRQMADVAALAT